MHASDCAATGLTVLTYNNHKLGVFGLFILQTSESDAYVSRVNDRIISANGVSLENVEYATAVQVLRDSGNTVLLVVRRRVVLPACPEPQTLKLSLTKSKKKDGEPPHRGCCFPVRTSD